MPKRLHVLFDISYPLAAFPRGVYAAFVNSLLPLYLATFTNNPAIIGLLVTISAFEGALTPLVIGPLTDRTKSSVGRRKIYILIGTILTSVLLLLYPLAHNLSILVGIILLAGIASNIPAAPHLAMISLNSTIKSRSQVVAFIGIWFLLGEILLSILGLIIWKAEVTPGVFVILSVLFLVPSIPLLLFSHDESSPRESSQKFDKKRFFAFFTNKKRNIFMFSIGMLWFGIFSVLPFFTLFVKNYLHLPGQKAIFFYMLIVIASGLFAYPFALLGKKYTESRVLQFGLLFLLAAGFMGIFAKQLPEVLQYSIAICAGVGYAAITALGYSIFSKIVPEKSLGMAGGIFSFLIAGLAPIAASFSGFVISLFNYPAMFIILSITTIISILCIHQKYIYEH